MQQSLPSPVDRCSLRTNSNQQGIHNHNAQSHFHHFFLEEHLTIDRMVDEVFDHPHSLIKLFGSRHRGKPERKDAKQFVLVMLVKGIVCHHVCYDDDEEDENMPLLGVKLGLDSNNALLMNTDKCWLGINTF